MSKQKVVVVAGPTASGKTGLGVLLAKEFSGEVISADSMQIYRGFSVLSAKPTLEEQAGIPHHLMGFLEETETFSVAQYVKKARGMITQIDNSGKLPLLVGGTGLYIDALIENFCFDEENSTGKAVRERLLKEAEETDNAQDYLYKKLEQLDLKTAETIHPNNRVKVLRALEVCLTSGMTMSEYQRKVKQSESAYSYLYLVLTYTDRELLYRKINRRVDSMFSQGLLEEARRVYTQENVSVTAKAAIGYKELIPYFQGEADLETCKEKIKQNTRRYAKRQLTWFKKRKDALFLPVDTLGDRLYQEAQSAVRRLTSEN